MNLIPQMTRTYLQLHPRDHYTVSGVWLHENCPGIPNEGQPAPRPLPWLAIPTTQS